MREILSDLVAEEQHLDQFLQGLRNRACESWCNRSWISTCKMYPTGYRQWINATSMNWAFRHLRMQSDMCISRHPKQTSHNLPADNIRVSVVWHSKKCWRIT